MKGSILPDAETSTPLVSLPENFTEKKKIQQMVPISKHEYTQFTQKPISIYSKTNKIYSKRE